MRSGTSKEPIESLSVVGSRSLDPNVPVRSDQAKRNKKRAFRILDKIHARNGIESVVSGGAFGPDSWGEEWAELNDVPCWVIKPDWDRHGRAAGFIRNADIINAGCRVVAFWDGESNGTLDSINKAKKQRKPRKVIIMDKA